jgi:hypothetical protein
MKTKPVLPCLYILIAHTVWAETTPDIESTVRLALEKNLSLERPRMESAAAKRKHGRSRNSLVPALGLGAAAVRPTSITGPSPWNLHALGMNRPAAERRDMVVLIWKFCLI